MLWLHKFAQADNVALSGFPHILLGTKANDRMAVEGVDVTCRDCLRSVPVPFAVLALPDETLFPQIVKPRRFRCANCGPVMAFVTLDWRGRRAPGAGGM